MSFGVSGISATTALFNYSQAQRRIQDDSAALSSGVNSAADNPSGLAISQSLQAGVNGAGQAAENDQNALDALNVTSGATQSTESVLQQLDTLAVQASNDTVTASDRADIEAQANQLVAQINTNATQTPFNGAAQTQVPTAAELGVGTLDFSSTQGAQVAQTSIQNALTTLSSQQAQLGAQQVTINEDVDNENTLSTNLQASESAIADTNVPQATTDLNQANVQSNVALDVIAAVNQENATLAGMYIDQLA